MYFCVFIDKKILPLLPQIDKLFFKYDQSCNNTHQVAPGGLFLLSERIDGFEPGREGIDV